MNIILIRMKTKPLQISQLVRTILVLLITLSLSLAAHETANAQTGTVFAGGGIGFSSQSDKLEGTAFEDFEESVITFSVTPSIGYYVTDDLAVGLGLGFESSSLEDEVDDIEQSRSVFFIAPFARYVSEVTESMKLFGQFGVTYGFGTGEEETPGGNTIESEVTLIEVGIHPGLTFFLSESWAIEPTFGFLGYRSESLLDRQEVPDEGFVDVERETSEFGLDLDLSTLQLGLKYYF